MREELPVVGRRVVHGVCPHDCPDTCGLRVTVEDGRAVKVEGDPTHPITRGFLCAKVNHYLEHVYNPRRVLTPRKRVGPKGSGEFQEITWDEALDTIAARFRAIVAEHGGEAILPYSYSGTLGLLNNSSMDYRFFHRLGATRLDRTICVAAAVAGNAYTLGCNYGTDPENFPDAKLIVCWGTNPVTSNPHLLPFVKEAQDRGARLVVIDPRRTRTAERADWHIQPLPGSDAALALGMMHVIIAEGLYDAGYVRDYTVGFDELRARAAAYPPARVAALTGLPAETVVELARLYATTRPAVLRLQYGMQRHTNGGMVVRTIACLPALVGAWRDAAGGLLIGTSGAFPLNMRALTRPDLLRGRTPRHVNMIQLGRALTALDSPPIKGLYVYNADPVASAPQSGTVLAGLRRDDLFTVVHDIYFTDTTAYADIVLPATTQLEQWDLHKAYGNYYLQVNQPAIAPVGESKPNTEVFRLLAARLGFDEPCFRDGDLDLIDQALAGEHPWLAGITRERLLRDGWAKLTLPADERGRFAPFAQGGFGTPSGKVEFYSARMAADGHDPLPAHAPLAEGAEATPALHARYPLTLISPKAHHFVNSTFNGDPTPARREGRPTVELHPADAAARGIVDGDRVRVFNDRGACLLHARVTDGVREGVAVSPATWWPRAFPDGRGINHLTPDREADLGGGATFYTNLVEVERAGDDGPGPA
ncbi:MAG TPA: molybdopterin oxidoreductase family protein [Thermomicrobiales bacterium]|nr:molybdopterin oxidoreductase family protein [Thermomicrobiales bacterium]